jgi:hypothetical protein
VQGVCRCCLQKGEFKPDYDAVRKVVEELLESNEGKEGRAKQAVRVLSLLHAKRRTRSGRALAPDATPTTIYPFCYPHWIFSALLQTTTTAPTAQSWCAWPGTPAAPMTRTPTPAAATALRCGEQAAAGASQMCSMA